MRKESETYLMLCSVLAAEDEDVEYRLIRSICVSNLWLWTIIILLISPKIH